MAVWKTLALGLLSALLGAIAGAVIGFALVIGIGLAAGDTGREGALAMGAATVGLPFGAVVGGLIGGVGMVRRSTGGPFLMGARGWAVVGGATLLLTLALAIRIWSMTIPEFGMPRPDLLVEVRVPTGAIDPDSTRFLPLSPLYIRAGTYVPPFRHLDRRTEGGFDIALLRYVMVYKVEPRELALEIERDIFAVFPLDLGRVPVPTDGYTQWQAPTFKRFQGGKTEPYPDEGAPEVAIRHRVRWDKP